MFLNGIIVLDSFRSEGVMLYIKGCTTCGGDVAELSDMYGPYLDCMQCGRNPAVAIKEGLKNAPISIDESIELLWLLSSQKPINPKEHPLTGSLEKRLKDLEQHKYVAQEGAEPDVHYAVTQKGKEVVDGYRSFVQKALNGGSLVISYNLVGEDGNLTMIGRYAIKHSKILSEFVGDIYFMAVISLEDLETESPE